MFDKFALGWHHLFLQKEKGNASAKQKALNDKNDQLNKNQMIDRMLTLCEFVNCSHKKQVEKGVDRIDRHTQNLITSTGSVTWESKKSSVREGMTMAIAPSTEPVQHSECIERDQTQVSCKVQLVTQSVWFQSRMRSKFVRAPCEKLNNSMPKIVDKGRWQQQQMHLFFWIELRFGEHFEASQHPHSSFLISGNTFNLQVLERRFEISEGHLFVWLWITVGIDTISHMVPIIASSVTQLSDKMGWMSLLGNNLRVGNKTS
jgi:hypothetical protein